MAKGATSETPEKHTNHSRFKGTRLDTKSYLPTLENMRYREFIKMFSFWNRLEFLEDVIKSNQNQLYCLILDSFAGRVSAAHRIQYLDHRGFAGTYS